MNDYTRIRTSTPINGTAAIVAGPGIGWTPVVDIEDWFEEQPQTMGPTYKLRTNPEWKDYSRRTFGRLTVLGLRRTASENGVDWVCRCSCGGYCLRRSEQLRRDVAYHAEHSMCGLCKYKKPMFARKSETDARPPLTRFAIDKAIAAAQEGRARPGDVDILAEAAARYLCKGMKG